MSVNIRFLGQLYHFYLTAEDVEVKVGCLNAMTKVHTSSLRPHTLASYTSSLRPHTHVGCLNAMTKVHKRFHYLALLALPVNKKDKY